MKKGLWLVLVFLMAFVLGACAMSIPGEIETTTAETTQAMAETTQQTESIDPYVNMTEEEKAVAQCRAVLDAVQSGTNYHITLTRWYEGVVDSTLQADYYRSGNHRVMVSKETAVKDDADGQFPNWMGTGIRVFVNNQFYSGYALTGEPMVWEGPLEGETLNFDPWMYTFDWDAQPVQLQEIRKTGEGRCVTFQVEGTYPGDRVLSEYYTITFYFDENDNFLMRELTATGVEQTFTIENGMAVPSGQPADTNIILTRVDRVTIESLDPDVCAAQVNDLYQEARTYQYKN